MGTVSPWIVVAVAAGLAGSGLAATVVLRTKPIGPFALVSAVLWLITTWPVSTIGDAQLRVVGVVCGLLLPVALLICLAAMVPRGLTRTSRRVLTAGAAVWCTLAGLLAVVYDPLFDLGCWQSCESNPLLVAHAPILARIVTAALLVAIVLLPFAGISMLWRARQAWSRYALRTDGACAVAAFSAIVAQAASAAMVLASRVEGRYALDPVLTSLEAATLALLAAALAWSVVTELRRRRAVQELARDLADHPGVLLATLTRLFRDPALRVVFRRSRSEGYIDGSGEPADPAPGRGQSVTWIHRGGEAIAAIVHTDAVERDTRLTDRIGASAALAFDNERLHAEVRAHLRELKESRRRLVGRIDAERARLERDLHDGAQPLLLGAAVEMRVLSTRLDAEGERDAAATVVQATVGTMRAVSELRRIAHGVMPAELAAAGLRSALPTLVEDSPIAVGFRGIPTQRIDPDIEQAVLAIVGDTVRASARGGVAALDIEFEASARTLSMRICGAADDAYLPASDRAGAVGGAADIEDGSLRVVLPCA